MRGAAFLCLTVFVGACGSTDLGVPTTADRQAAEQFAERSITDRFPDYPPAAAAPVATCIRTHATEDEIMLLAGKAPTTSERSRRTLAVSIAARPAAQTCIRNNNVPPLG